MNLTTLDYYQTHAHDFAEQSFSVEMQSLYRPFLQHLPQNATTILDVGSGSGRDSLYFAEKGYQVTAIDGSKALIDLAKSKISHVAIDWQVLTFDQIQQHQWQKKFDGIWACASLLHVNFLTLTALINTVISLLKLNGVLYISFKYGDTEREKEGRFFCDIDENRWQIVINQLTHVNQIETWITHDNRPNRSEIWLNILLKSTF